MRKTAFFVGYGLLPFWAAIAIVFIGGVFSHSNEYWAVAPWLIVVSIPMSGATLLVAKISLAVRARAGGDESRKLRIATITFWGLNAVLVGIAGTWWMQSAALERRIDNEKKAAEDFVRNHSSVVKQFGRDVGVRVASYSHAGGGRAMPQKYEISIDTKQSKNARPDSRYVYAIVSVNDSSGQREFVLDCLTPVSMGHRDPFKDPCKQ